MSEVVNLHLDLFLGTRQLFLQLSVECAESISIFVGLLVSFSLLFRDFSSAVHGIFAAEGCEHSDAAGAVSFGRHASHWSGLHLMLRRGSSIVLHHQ